MTEKIRWGILSTARIGRDRVIPAMQKAHNAEVTAVASRNLATAESFAADLGIPRAFGSYEEMLADPDIDAIYNPLPNNLHAEWSIRCAEAGKATLCEKPLASNAAEAQTMVDAFAKHNVPFAEAFMYRFHPQTQTVKRLIDEGAIGTVNSIASAFTFPIGNEDDIRLKANMAGGGLMDVGCYCISIMRYLTGEEPTTGKALAVIGERSQVDESLVGILQFPSGVLGHFDCGVRSHVENNYEVRGTKGRILVERAFVIPQEDAVIRVWRGNDYEEIRVLNANSYTLMTEDFSDAILNKRPPLFAPQDAVANMAVIDLLLASLPQA